MRPPSSVFLTVDKQLSLPETCSPGQGVMVLGRSTVGGMLVVFVAFVSVVLLLAQTARPPFSKEEGALGERHGCARGAEAQGREAGTGAGSSASRHRGFEGRIGC